MEAGKGL